MGFHCESDEPNKNGCSTVILAHRRSYHYGEDQNCGTCPFAQGSQLVADILVCNPDLYIDDPYQQFDKVINAMYKNNNQLLGSEHLVILQRYGRIHTTVLD